MLKRIVLTFLSVFVMSMFCLAEDTVMNQESSKKAEEILKKVKEVNTKDIKDFTATLVQSGMDDKQNDSTYYQKNNKDGSSFIRIEQSFNKEKIVVIMNNDGVWSITGNQATKINYIGKMKMNIMQSYFKSIETTNETVGKPSYGLTEKLFEDIPCFLIKGTQEYSNNMKKSMKEEINKAMPSIMKKYFEKTGIDEIIPYINECYIGKENYFIYGIYTYNKNGKRISSAVYKNVKINTGLKDDLFKVPKTAKIKVVDAIDEEFKKFKK